MNTNKSIEVVKQSGQIETFDEEKFCSSLTNIGLSEAEAMNVCKKIWQRLPRKTSSKTIFQTALKELNSLHPSLPTRYSLKHSIYLLGPAGYNFEQFFSHILHHYDYKTETNVMVRGKCLEYETDIVAQHQSERFLIEAKFHQVEGIKTDLQTVLYVYGRFTDILEYQSEEQRTDFALKTKAWLVTNTKITGEGISFGECRGIKMTAWHYPENESLEKLIEAKKLYPVTILLSAPASLSKIFIQKNIFLVIDLLKYSPTELSKLTNINQRKLEQIFTEAKQLLELN
jgi:hypothetical protein